MTGYTKDIELKMKWLFTTLSEKNRCRYAAIEAVQLSPDGIGYISSLFDIDPKTVRHELTAVELPEDPAQSRVRNKMLDANS